ncbi:hypothetical protein D9M71_209010 [compost metagenome]|uniref:DUF4381 domain-containing protein n=1 Tax=Pseudomonas jinjuensis TaxID=198616 RepID=A0A1H0BFL1_9PSED|nr:DUF4381 domain-containing protein [Pseudomonas jinjuensis]SDN44396.1 protein of unknown function [Pseudomonas jinjuensis]
MKEPSLDQLRELPLPAPPSWLPQTWGWAALGGLLALAALAWAGLAWHRWQRDRYRREALAQLAALQQAFAVDPQALRELPGLLKRAALSIAPREEVATLRGDRWQAFLQQRCATPLPEDFAARLARLAYAPDAQLPQQDAGELFAIARQWLETHHVAA